MKNNSLKVNTYFASAERSGTEQISNAALKIEGNLIITEILRTYGSILAILNKNRQIIAANEVLIKTLGCPDVREILGLRPGEAINCIHSNEGPGGCGTSEFCSTCGAVVAIVLSQKTNESVERECLITIKGDHEIAIEFDVRAVPVEIEGEQLVVLMLQDISDRKRRESLEQVFYHDLMNSIMSLSGFVEIFKLTEHEKQADILEKIELLCSNLIEQVKSQRVLSKIEKGQYQLEIKKISVLDMMNDIEKIFCFGWSGKGVELEVSIPEEDEVIESDPTLLYRVLINMCKNAMEATPGNGVAKLWYESSLKVLKFNVWNEGEILKETATRIFQRYFSTKKEQGRGLGTYSMKLFGEGFLHGKVNFTTSSTDGTIFSLEIPRRFS